MQPHLVARVATLNQGMGTLRPGERECDPPHLERALSSKGHATNSRGDPAAFLKRIFGVETSINVQMFSASFSVNIPRA